MTRGSCLDLVILHPYPCPTASSMPHKGKGYADGLTIISLMPAEHGIRMLVIRCDCEKMPSAVI